MNAKVLKQQRDGDYDDGVDDAESSSNKHCSRRNQAGRLLISLSIALVLSHSNMFFLNRQIKQLGILHLSASTNTTTADNETSIATAVSAPPVVLLEPKNRSIVVVHVGKCGGSTLRLSTGVKCNRNPVMQYKPDMHAKVEQCITKQFKPDQLLARQTRFVFHMFAYDDAVARNATSFLVTLRNPVDRIISTYKYSHPVNCFPTPKGVPKSYGCYIAQHKSFNDTKSSMYKTWRVCFPNPAMEQFAQSVMGPYPEGQFVNNTPVMKKKLQLPCRKQARNLVFGRRQKGSHPAPHMIYNYKHYAGITLDKYPEKEVFAIRTDHEWEDMITLDKSLGGSGIFQNEGKSVSHGSEGYAPSPLSTEAYQKLCCVLEEEIVVYLRILNRAVNFANATKRETEESLRTKCGITKPWDEWRTDCKEKIEADNNMMQHVKPLVPNA